MAYKCNICQKTFIKKQHLKAHYSWIHDPAPNWINHIVDKNKVIQMFSDIPVYWINLERAVDRNKKMTDMFEKYNIKNIRINAYDGDIIRSYKDIEYTANKTVYEMGCVFSHLKTIKTAYENNEDIAIIMEDDIIIDYCDKWKYQIGDIIDLAPDNWEIIKLHTVNASHISTLLQLSNDVLFTPWVANSFSAGCYVINKNGMKNILDKYYYLNKFVINHPNPLADYIIYFSVKTYDYVFPIFTHELSPSFINNNDLYTHKNGLVVLINFFNSLENNNNDDDNIL